MSHFEQNQRLSIIGGILQHETRLLPELWSRSCIRAVAIWLLFKGRPSAAPLSVLLEGLVTPVKNRAFLKVEGKMQKHERSP